MISFIRIDDRIIHGQIVIRWSTEYPCDGIIAVDDKSATNEVLRSALKSATGGIRTLVYTREQFLEKMAEAVGSEKNYFVITKGPSAMAELLVDHGMKTETKMLNVGPQSARQGTYHVNRNAEITKEEMRDYERMHDLGYKISFQLVPDNPKVEWKDVREKLLAM